MEDLSGALEKVHGSQIGKPISCLDLSVRSENALRAANIKSIGDLVQMSEDEACSISNLGKISAKELKKKLADHGLCFGMRFNQPAV